MNFFWVYDLPNWLFATLFILFFVFVAVAGLIALRRFIVRRVILQAHNDVVSFFMAGMNAIYGITLGLIAVGAWEVYSDVDNTVSGEASALAALYQDVGGVPGALGDTLRADIREYVHYTIEDAWPQQQRGILPHGGTARMTRIQKALQQFEPTTKNQEIQLAEAYKQFNNVIEWRRKRLKSVTEGLPAAIWYIIFFGAILNIVITWFFVTDKFRVHVLMTALFAALLGSLIYLIAAMDNPFRGDFSVSPDALQIVLDNMK